MADSSLVWFNVSHGYVDGMARGLKKGLLTAPDYSSLGQCESLEDLRVHLASTDYGELLRQEFPTLDRASQVAQLCLRKVVSSFEAMRRDAVGPLTTFLEFISHSYMIDNVVLMVMGTLHGRDTRELVEKCHPLGLFDTLPALAVATSVDELYRIVLVDTPLAPYFAAAASGAGATSAFGSSSSLQQGVGGGVGMGNLMSTLLGGGGSTVGGHSADGLSVGTVEVLRNALFKEWLDAFYAWCRAHLNPAGCDVMGRILCLEADRRALTIAVNSVGAVGLGEADRKRLFNNFGTLFPYGVEALAACEDGPQIAAAIDACPAFLDTFLSLGIPCPRVEGVGGGGGGGAAADASRRTATVTVESASELDKAFFVAEAALCRLAFMQNMHFGVFWAILKLQEQEARNLLWIAECVSQSQRGRVLEAVIC